ncbi:2-succinyl-6-hydroxy-2,4-cyclohexadiene-1-carboxylate synthase [Nostoc sp. MG11]|uniref:2-succinyl-6-hydroxy-2, 4-cyclohexadiene-1-carboxylate synthase n=1 Tax=Nostoc sp. MG11 TaxID=2721166 RepID=UPI0018682E51|nr:2-succinyl-6-hydroxy-2,4-cyclohexadiene-1-carboxylate synthase [Nostoc sp. MG11]
MISENYQFHYCLISNVDKPLILFLHGFMGSMNEFDEAIKLLSNDEFSYLIIDLPGHGKTQVLGGEEYYTIENTADALINLLDDLIIAKCFLVGYSMGGRLGLYLTLHFPERFYKVVLESASPGLPTKAERLERIKRDMQIGRKLIRNINKIDTAFLANWYNQSIFGSIKNHPQYDRMIESRLQNHPLELDKSLRFMGTGCQPSLWAKLKENTIPMLLLTGEYDEKFIDINIKMTKVCEFSQLEIIDNAGHNIHFENTLAFVQNVKNFFTQ